LLAVVSDGKAFRNGRQFAAWLGLSLGAYRSTGKTHRRNLWIADKQRKLVGVDRGSYQYEPRPDRDRSGGTDTGDCMHCWCGAIIRPA